MNTKQTSTTWMMTVAFTIVTVLSYGTAIAQDGKPVDVYASESKVEDLFSKMKPLSGADQEAPADTTDVDVIKLEIAPIGNLQYSYARSMRVSDVEVLIREANGITSIKDALQLMIAKSEIRGEITEPAYKSVFRGHLSAGEANSEDVYAAGLDLTCIKNTVGATIYGIGSRQGIQVDEDSETEEIAPFNDAASKYLVVVNDGSGIRTYDQFCNKYSLEEDLNSDFSQAFIRWVNEIKGLRYASDKKLLDTIIQVMPASASLNLIAKIEAHKELTNFETYYSNGELSLLQDAWNEYLEFVFVFGGSEKNPMSVIKKIAGIKLPSKTSANANGSNTQK